MKKTAIVTQFYKSFNYGGVIQAYALQNCLRELGVENELAQVDFYSGQGFKKRQAAQQTRRYPLPFRVYRKACQLIERCLLARRKGRFERFKAEHMAVSDVVYSDANIQQANQRYDCFVAGSDQIWNPSQSCDAFFLTFAEENCRKISYAASIGVDSVSQEYLRYIVPLIDRFDAVSVREPSAVKILEGHVHKPVSCVLDPTLLLSKERWEKLCHPSGQKGDYIFVYLLGNSERGYRLAQEVSEKLHTRVVLVPFGARHVRKSVMQLHGKWALSASPADFLSLVHDARYVITDSFHGAVFSLIFHKSFCAIERVDGGSSSPMNARLYDLLGTAGLPDRLQRDAAGAVAVLQEPIDFASVDARLAERIEYSKDFLRRALELEPGEKEA